MSTIVGPASIRPSPTHSLTAHIPIWLSPLSNQPNGSQKSLDVQFSLKPSKVPKWSIFLASDHVNNQPKTEREKVHLQTKPKS